MTEFLILERPEKDFKDEYFFLRKNSVYGILFNHEHNCVELTIKNITKCWFTATPLEEIIKQMEGV